MYLSFEDYIKSKLHTRMYYFHLENIEKKKRKNRSKNRTIRVNNLLYLSQLWSIAHWLIKHIQYIETLQKLVIHHYFTKKITKKLF